MSVPVKNPRECGSASRGSRYSRSQAPTAKVKSASGRAAGTNANESPTPKAESKIETLLLRSGPMRPTKAMNGSITWWSTLPKIEYSTCAGIMARRVAAATACNQVDVLSATLKRSQTDKAPKIGGKNEVTNATLL